MTKRFAVLGSPISHSLSPKIHAAAFEFSHTPASYEMFDVSELEPFLRSHSDFAGFSLTMPLKTQAYELASRLSAEAQLSESVNTLIREVSSWHGYNTDIFGIKMALSGVTAKSALVIGTGATARSAIIALQEMNLDVFVWGRDEAKIRELTSKYGVSEAKDLFHGCQLEIVVSTLPPRALDEHLSNKLEPTGLLLDVAYNPWPSAAASLWSKSGESRSGIEMLIWQAIAQQRLFQGNKIDQPLEDEQELYLFISKALGMAK